LNVSAKTTSFVGQFIAYLRAKRLQLITWFLIFLFFAAYLAPRVIRPIYSGHAAVPYRLFHGGTDTRTIRSEGVHFTFPWDYLSIYDLRIQEMRESLDLLTKNGLTVTLDVSIRFRPERPRLGELHQNVGEDYARKIVVPEVVSALRTAVGAFTAEELYSTKPSILEHATCEAIRQVSCKYVLIDDVIIRSIRLPPAVKMAVENKVEQLHLAEAYEFRLIRARQEAATKKIEAEGERAYNEMIAPSLTSSILQWKGIEAIRQLAASPNAKVIVVGNGPGGLPIILGPDGNFAPSPGTVQSLHAPAAHR
jgi:regulator of protease activity HflC (stomatin/prohibitin superfamily)